MSKWQDKEKSDSKLFGSKRTPRSGGLWFAKGDSKSEKFLIENKTTEHESFGISSKIWNKIEREALLNSRMPILSILFGKEETELVIMSKEDFLTLI
jgi:hypothetical protein